jgi:hypothetical protein
MAAAALIPDTGSGTPVAGVDKTSPGMVRKVARCSEWSEELACVNGEKFDRGRRRWLL